MVVVCVEGKFRYSSQLRCYCCTDTEQSLSIFQLTINKDMYILKLHYIIILFLEMFVPYQSQV